MPKGATFEKRRQERSNKKVSPSVSFGKCLLLGLACALVVWNVEYDQTKINFNGLGEYLGSITSERRVNAHPGQQLPTIVPYDNATESMAVCLMIMDDNHYLIEWLAYHYHVLPLRRLVVHVDPKSTTNPMPILNRWKDRINISFLGMKDIYPGGVVDNRTNMSPVMDEAVRHNEFMRKCIKVMNEEKRSWVYFTDTDEYTLINPNARIPHHPIYNYGRNNFIMPTQKEPGSILYVLKWIEANPSQTNLYLTNRSCINVMRHNYGAREPPSIEMPNSTAAHLQSMNMNASHFQTLRWRYHGQVIVKDTGLAATPGKMMVDLSRIDDALIEKNHAMVHIPIPHACDFYKYIHQTDNETLFILHHYSGTLEQIMFRSNDRRGANQDGRQARIDRYNNDKRIHDGVLVEPLIQEWLSGFIETVGEAEAQRLLEHVGNTKLAAYYDWKG